MRGDVGQEKIAGGLDIFGGESPERKTLTGDTVHWVYDQNF